MEICTIGFTRHSAAEFFGALRSAGVRRLVDVRLHNTSQLAGFAKRDDLAWFLAELGGIAYEHEPSLAPTAELLDGYKKRRLSWPEYEAAFLGLMRDRRIEQALAPARFEEERTVLLCSEHGPGRCHRRLVVDYLSDQWPGVKALHL